MEPRLTSGAAVKELGLEPGANVSRESVESALGEIEYSLAKERALKVLSYREYSSFELRRKLEEAGYPSATARSVVERFTEVELVDDRRFATAWARSRVREGYGRRRIRQELSQRGIPDELADVALSDALDETDEIELARQALRHRVPRDRAERERFIRKLLTRGFSAPVALRAVSAEGVEDTEMDYDDAQ